MNKSLLIQNGIAGGIAGTVADGLFKDEDNHSYAKSAFMGTLAGVGATALHQKWPVTKSGAQAPADHVPPTAPVQQPTAAEQPKVAEPIASKQESPVVAQAQPAAPQPVQRPSAQAAETPEPVAPIKPEEPAKPIQTPVAPAESVKQPTAASEPVQQPAAAPSVEKQTERERIIEREPEARAQVEPKPAEQPKAVQPVQTEPVKPIQITPEKQPEPATQPVQQRRQKPVRPTPKVVRNEPKPEEFVGPHDQSKLTKTINSVKQSASNVGNGILEGAKNIVATASKLKIPPIELNISGAGKQIAQAGRSIASGLARSAQALSIAAIASMDMGGSHAVVQHAYETATHAVQVQASMATSTMTRAVKDVGEAVSNYHPMQGVENAVRNTAAIPQAVNNTIAGKAISGAAEQQELASRIIINKKNNGDPFIIVDPIQNKISSYSASGHLLGSASVSTPSGGYNDSGLSPAMFNEYYDLGKTEKNNAAMSKFLERNNVTSVASGISVYGKSSSLVNNSRVPILIDTTPIDRKMSYTRSETQKTDIRYSINGQGRFATLNPVSQVDFQKQILDRVGDSPLVAIMPSSRSADRMLGLHNDPMRDNNEIAEEISSKMNPTSNFLVADKKDNLIGLYNPEGRLLNYYPAGFGRDSAKGESHWSTGPNAAIINAEKDAVKRQILMDKYNGRVTPSGVFKMTKRYSPNSQESGIGENYKPGVTPILAYKNFRSGDKSVFAVHDVSYGQRSNLSQFANRNYNPNSPALASNGCVLLDDKVMQNAIMPALANETLLAVMPNSGKLQVGATTQQYRQPTNFEHFMANTSTAINKAYDKIVGNPTIKSQNMLSQISNSKPEMQNTTMNKAILDAAMARVDTRFKPSLENRCADSVSAIVDDAIKNSGLRPDGYKHTVMAAGFGTKGMGMKKIDPKDVQPGDIVTFTNTWRKSKNSDDATHVGVYTGNNLFAHRPAINPMAHKQSAGGAIVEENIESFLKNRKSKGVEIGGIYRFDKFK